MPQGPGGRKDLLQSPVGKRTALAGIGHRLLRWQRRCCGEGGLGGQRCRGRLGHGPARGGQAGWVPSKPGQGPVWLAGTGALGQQGPDPGGRGAGSFRAAGLTPGGQRGGLLWGSRGRTWGALFPAWAPQALTRVGTATGSGSSSSGVRKRMAKDRYLSRGRKHVGAIFCGDTRSGREQEQRPPLPP